MDFSCTFLALTLFAGCNLSSVYSESKSDNPAEEANLNLNTSDAVYLLKDGILDENIGLSIPHQENPEPKKTKKKDDTTMELRGVLSHQMKLTNTGKSLEAVPEKPCTSCQTSGGPLPEGTFAYGKTEFYWTSSEDEITEDTIFYKGSPITISNFFYNTRYNTLENSLKYSDGTVQTIFSVDICSTPSETFKPFALALEKIQYPGNSTTTELGDSFAFYSPIPPNATYYVYQDLTKQFSGIIILMDYPPYCISNEQYENSFKSMKDEFGESFINTQQQFSLEKPISEGTGVNQECSKSEGSDPEPCP